MKHLRLLLIGLIIIIFLSLIGKQTIDWYYNNRLPGTWVLTEYNGFGDTAVVVNKDIIDTIFIDANRNAVIKRTILPSKEVIKFQDGTWNYNFCDQIMYSDKSGIREVEKFNNDEIVMKWSGFGQMEHESIKVTEGKQRYRKL